MRYSIVVFPANSASSDGHVGWVNALLQNSNHQVIGIQIDEGNVNGLGNCNSVLTNEDIYFSSAPSRFSPPATWRYIPAT
jgi:hypothetical protein